MLHPSNIENPKLFFERDDPFSEAQRLQQECRREPRVRTQREMKSDDVLFIDADKSKPSQEQPLEGAGRRRAHRGGDAREAVEAEAFTTPRLAAPRRSDAARAAAEIKFRRLTVEKDRDFSRRNVLLKEQLRHECRLPPAATWAGQQGAIRERFNRQATIRHELGDGRTLLQERRGEEYMLV
mmetsp:Transcript_52136/g.97541  ORF Transcript_52136/g.97541 Transcript_52136/m.97541 type:complete len:182 (-) Transcript_52136:91-636(-)